VLRAKHPQKKKKRREWLAIKAAFPSFDFPSGEGCDAA
jgi:hypothetical protein